MGGHSRASYQTLEKSLVCDGTQFARRSGVHVSTRRARSLRGRGSRAEAAQRSEAPRAWPLRGTDLASRVGHTGTRLLVPTATRRLLGGLWAVSRSRGIRTGVLWTRLMGAGELGRGWETAPCPPRSGCEAERTRWFKTGRCELSEAPGCRGQRPGWGAWPGEEATYLQSCLGLGT